MNIYSLISLLLYYLMKIESIVKKYVFFNWLVLLNCLNLIIKQASIYFFLRILLHSFRYPRIISNEMKINWQKKINKDSTYKSHKWYKVSDFKIMSCWYLFWIISKILFSIRAHMVKDIFVRIEIIFRHLYNL